MIIIVQSNQVSSDPKYLIKHLASLTSVKAHTIRIWEKRYNLLSPRRTDTNIRKYSDDDLKKLLGVSTLIAKGHKISEISKMSETEFRQAVYSLQPDVIDNSLQVESLIGFMLELNETGINSIIRRYSDIHGFEDCIESLLFPFFNRIGVMWQTGSISPAQEHFISGIVRAHLITATDRIPVKPSANPPVVFFLPEDELHELSLLYYHYVVRLRGYRTLYLGQAVPHYSLPELILQSGTKEMVFVSTSSANLENLKNAFLKINAMGLKVYGSGSLLQQIDMKIYPSISVFKEKKELLDLLDKND